jgi:hypothetical protein
MIDEVVFTVVIELVCPVVIILGQIYPLGGGGAGASANRGKSRNWLQSSKRNIIGYQPYNYSAGDYNAL